MQWKTEEFGSSHEGWAGALLADGSEPGPVHLDPGSGSGFHETREWWAYSGRFGRPKAVRARGACSCGWRSASSHPIDWEAEETTRLFEPYIDGPQGDWDRHIQEVEARTVPLPAELADLIGRVEERLEALAQQAPVAALKAVAALERATKRVARDAAYMAEADDLSWESIGTGLGLSEKGARSRLTHYTLRP